MLQPIGKLKQRSVSLDHQMLYQVVVVVHPPSYQERCLRGNTRNRQKDRQKQTTIEGLLAREKCSAHYLSRFKTPERRDGMNERRGREREKNKTEVVEGSVVTRDWEKTPFPKRTRQRSDRSSVIVIAPDKAVRGLSIESHSPFQPMQSTEPESLLEEPAYPSACLSPVLCSCHHIPAAEQHIAAAAAACRRISVRASMFSAIYMAT